MVFLKLSILLLQSTLNLSGFSKKQNSDLLIIHYIKDSWKSVQVTRS
jgi:hypothetical protein